MNDLNSVLIEGALAENPVLSKTENGGPICYFTITHRRTNCHTHFKARTYGKQAEICGENLTAGRKVRVVGKLMRETKRSNLGLVVSDEVYLLAEYVEIRPPKVQQPESAEEAQNKDKALDAYR